MNDELMNWAIKHGVCAAALDDLRTMLMTGSRSVGASSEARVASAVQLEASTRGDIVLWRNNVGALRDERGRLVRYGLANESKAVNDRIKSADLIGIYRRKITPADVGKVIGQFLSVETKAEGWRWSGSAREVAQAAWASGVTAWGGVAVIHSSATSPVFAELAR